MSNEWAYDWWVQVKYAVYETGRPAQQYRCDGLFSDHHYLRNWIGRRLGATTTSMLWLMVNHDLIAGGMLGTKKVCCSLLGTESIEVLYMHSIRHSIHTDTYLWLTAMIDIWPEPWVDWMEQIKSEWNEKWWLFHSRSHSERMWTMNWIYYDFMRVGGGRRGRGAHYVDSVRTPIWAQFKPFIRRRAQHDILWVNGGDCVLRLLELKQAMVFEQTTSKHALAL